MHVRDSQTNKLAFEDAGHLSMAIDQVPEEDKATITMAVNAFIEGYLTGRKIKRDERSKSNESDHSSRT